MWKSLVHLFSLGPNSKVKTSIQWKPAQVVLSESPDAVIVDERPWVRAAWREAALQQGKSIWILPFPQPLLLRLETLPKQIPIYVGCTESEYGDGYAVAQHLSMRGFFQVIVQVRRVFSGEISLLPHNVHV